MDANYSVSACPAECWFIATGASAAYADANRGRARIVLGRAAPQLSSGEALGQRCEIVNCLGLVTGSGHSRFQSLISNPRRAIAYDVTSMSPGAPNSKFNISDTNGTRARPRPTQDKGPPARLRLERTSSFGFLVALSRLKFIMLASHQPVGTEHVLLGLLREGEGVAGQVLVNLGLTLEKARNYVRTSQATERENSPPPKDEYEPPPELDIE